MKYQDQIDDYKTNHEAQGPINSLAEMATKAKKDFAEAEVSLDPTIIETSTPKLPDGPMLSTTEAKATLPKKKLGRPFGSKAKHLKKRGPKPGSTRRAVPNEARLLVRMTQKLSDILHEEAEENFRGPGQEVNYILTKHYQDCGKL
jgi:hypothetical protein